MGMINWLTEYLIKKTKNLNIPAGKELKIVCTGPGKTAAKSGQWCKTKILPQMKELAADIHISAMDIENQYCQVIFFIEIGHSVLKYDRQK